MKVLYAYLIVFVPLFYSTIGHAQSENKEFAEIAVQPKFIGGDEALYMHIKNSIQFPEEVKALGMEGKVLVSFVISPDGSIKDESVKVVKGLHPLLDDEATRIIKELPKWKPGKMKDGTPTNVKMTLPVFMKPDQG